MNKLSITGLLAGIALLILLIALHNVGDITTALSIAGWSGVIFITVASLPAMLLCGLAWSRVFPDQLAGGDLFFMRARLIRDGVSNLIAVPLGEQVIGVRMLTQAGISTSLAAASVVVDLTTELLGQFLFTLIGLLLLSRTHPDNPVFYWAGLGALVAVPVLFGFIFMQVSGLRLLERLSGKLAETYDWSMLKGISSLKTGIHSLYEHRNGFRTSLLLHLLAWLLGVLPTWIGLRLLNHTLGLTDVTVIESMTFAIRTVAFFVPGALGVQEGAYILIGGLYGLTPETALALSLLKRGRDLLLGIPTLLTWQFDEVKSVWQRSNKQT